MGILDSIKKLFSKDTQADSEHERKQPQPPPQGTEGGPSEQAGPAAGDDTVNPAGESGKEDKDQDFVDLYDDKQ